MSEQYWGCSDILSEVNFSPAETLVFTIYGRGGHLGHVTKVFCINFGELTIRSLHIKFEFNWTDGLRENYV